MTKLHIMFLTLCLLASGVKASVVVNDDEGHQLNLTKPAARVISLAPNITELLFAAGGADRIVGVMRFSDYPEAAKTIPVIGDIHALDTERILSLRPDVLVVWRQGGVAKQIDQIQKLGIPVFYIDPHKLNDIPRSIEVLGHMMGTDQQASIATADLRQQLRQLSDQYAKLAPVRLFYQIWDKPLITLNDQHIVNDAIQLCGGVNIFAKLVPVSPSVSVESVLQENPQVIVGSIENNSTDGGVMAWKRYPTLDAVRLGNIVTVDGNLINRAGPRMIAGAAQLCEKLNQARGKQTALNKSAFPQR